uniref:Shikimate kinase n=1 Tax=Fundidesulfovibrio putealis TaxID=270496 RepID=A0A7C4ELL0_9BACT
MRFIRERFDVQEEDKTQSFRHDVAGQPLGGAGASLFFVGMPGSGRRELARRAAKALGLEYAEAATPESLLALAQDLKKARAVAVTAGGEALADPAVRDILRAGGKVFYLMSAAPILARNLGQLERVEDILRRLEALEPHFMSAAHFVQPVASTMEEMLEDVAEKARL